jgi:CrcB protein
VLTSVLARVVLVGVGGGLGSVLRYAARLGIEPKPGGLPWDTFVVNVVGSLIIGFVYPWLYGGERSDARESFGQFLTTGVIGGLTTYSAFCLQTVQMLRAGRIGQACAYVIATTVVCLVVCLLGMRLGRWVSA